MNKQEAIDLLKKEIWIKDKVISPYPKGFSDSDFAVDFDVANHIINQIDEQPKVVIPKFVAEWIERVRNKSLNLFDAYQSLIDDDRVKEWFIKPAHFDLFARAWLDGYHKEEDKELWKHSLVVCKRSGGRMMQEFYKTFLVLDPTISPELENFPFLPRENEVVRINGSDQLYRVAYVEFVEMRHQYPGYDYIFKIHVIPHYFRNIKVNGFL